MILRTFLILLSMIFACNTSLAADTYQTPEDFLLETFSSEVPEPKMIWLTGDRKDSVKQLLGHRYHNLRVRYWQKDQRSAWILEEIGKEKNITTGVVVNHGSLERIKVLIFRESRGGEVRYPFFTDQFKGIMLDKNRRLNRHIDGVSGATLSVRALKKMAVLALYLDAELRR